MKRLRSLHGRIRTLFSRTEHTGAQAGAAAGGEASTSGRATNSLAVKSTPTFKQFRGQGAQYGPQAPYRLPWKEVRILHPSPNVPFSSPRAMLSALETSNLLCTCASDLGYRLPVSDAVGRCLLDGRRSRLGAQQVQTVLCRFDLV